MNGIEFIAPRSVVRTGGTSTFEQCHKLVDVCAVHNELLVDFVTLPDGRAHLLSTS